MPHVLIAPINLCPEMRPKLLSETQAEGRPHVGHAVLDTAPAVRIG